MGGWKLEVFKMALYMSFPVGMFHYFNQPEYFEKWVRNWKSGLMIIKIRKKFKTLLQVTEKRREMFPPESKSHRGEIEVRQKA